MELLEKYIDDPNRDQIIAKEMGWHHLLDENGKDWSANLDTLFSQRGNENAKTADDEDEDDPDDEEDEDADDLDDEDFDEDADEGADDEETDEDKDEDEETEDRYSQHPLYQAASALAVHIDRRFADNDLAAQRPAVARLTTSATLANVKLAAALTDDDVDELGMTIAYLKRALKAVTNALEAVSQCEGESLLDALQARDVRDRIFQVRDGIVSLMGHYRNEWRRRYGQGH